MNRPIPTIASLVLLPILGVAACASPQQRVTGMEDTLSAAGFLVQPANTPDRTAMLQRLPPNTLYRTVRGDDVRYVYADPLVCQCLYTGGQQAFNTFQANRQAQRLADQQALTAETYQDASWNWQPWGFGSGWGRGF